MRKICKRACWAKGENKKNYYTTIRRSKSMLHYLNHVIEFVALGIECCGSNLSSLVHHSHGEKFAFSLGITPSANIRLVCNPHFNSPSTKRVGR